MYVYRLCVCLAVYRYSQVLNRLGKKIYRQQAGEIEALNRAMSNLRDYVVDSDPFLTSDRPYM
jgi:hypothetical protein